jgi:hypothetical protein
MSTARFNDPRTQAAGAFLGPFHTIALDYDGSNNLIYAGWALPGSGASKDQPRWRIAQLVYSGTNLTDVQWASGGLSFLHVWNDRAILAYS